MLVNVTPDQATAHVKFVSYDGAYPNLCRGRLCLDIDGKKVWFSDKVVFNETTEQWDRVDPHPKFWEPGGEINWRANTTTHGEWEIDVQLIPEQYRKYAAEIDREFNDNVEYGCCGGCH